MSDVLAMLFATYIMKGKWSYSEVPDLLKPQVKEILVDEGLGHLTGEPFNG
ncbi:hypothetical protein [Metabacillus indicus]|uniref:CD1375 family protein n=1 Tax=Metabacillus indicus TaxID=246786 RepID=UPI0013923AF5|nr:hypothetical protein [Metabacillus indicus]